MTPEHRQEVVRERSDTHGQRFDRHGNNVGQRTLAIADQIECLRAPSPPSVPGRVPARSSLGSDSCTYTSWPHRPGAPDRPPGWR